MIVVGVIDKVDDTCFACELEKCDLCICGKEVVGLCTEHLDRCISDKSGVVRNLLLYMTFSSLFSELNVERMGERRYGFLIGLLKGKVKSEFRRVLAS
jgi:hypothetical protein